MKKNIFFWVFFLLLIVALPLTVFLVRTRQELRKKALGGPARLFLNPSLGNFTPGSDLFIEIYLDTDVKSVNSFQILNLQFDPNVLEPIEATVSLEGAIPNFTQQVVNTIDPSTGKIKFARGVNSTNPSYFNGLGKIGLVKLRVKSSLDPNTLPLTTEVNFINESSVLITKVVEAVTSQDILGTKTGGSYTISISPTATITPGGPTFTPVPSGPTPTSTLTPIPTQTPTPTRTPTPTSGQGGPPTPTLTPTPILSEAILLGKVAKKGVPNCTDTYYYLGTSCGNSTCYGPPGFTVSFNQPNFSRSDSVGDDCADNLPRYTFESRSRPMGSQNGENAQVSLRLDNSSGYTGSWQWEVHTTNGSGNWLAGSQQTGVNTMAQDTLTINLKIYSAGDYKWNHLWFYYSPTLPTSTPTSTLTPTFTPVPTFTPTPTSIPRGPVTFNISAVFQAVYDDATVKQRSQKTVKLYLDNINEASESKIVDIVFYYSERIVNNLLVFVTYPVTVPDVKSGTYDISLKGPLHLTRSKENISLIPPQNYYLLDYTDKMLLGGDLTNTDSIIGEDDTILRQKFGSEEQGADIDFNGFVNIQDYTILAGNSSSPKNLGERCQIKRGRYCSVIIP